ncbi:hypothetical protein [Dyella sp. C11]|uniref:hypothetical protein n=1 Tax=Dyella sp. C11 TaxID=2126991 RepID=UPI000D659BF0|nr:hypothetical protein [Dyella sp. C11]
MASRIRKLTAVGLPAREELLVRSLLKMVSAKTTEEWMFQENLEANVALCHPDSALSMMALKRANSHGMLCVSVVHEDEHALPDTLMLRAPIRSADFIDVLNRASERLVHVVPAKASATTDEVTVEPLVLALRRLLLSGQKGFVAITVGASTLVLSTATRRLASASPLQESELLRLGLAGLYRWDVIDDEQGARAMAAAVDGDSLDRLLWLCGLQAPEALFDKSLPVDGTYVLRRWPDAGRLALEPYHLRMASLLVRQPMGARALADVTGRSVSEARAFLRACAMSCLLEEKALPASAGSGDARPMTPKRSRYGELFQSIRSVLGIRS